MIVCARCNSIYIGIYPDSPSPCLHNLEGVSWDQASSEESKESTVYSISLLPPLDVNVRAQVVFNQLNFGHEQHPDWGFYPHGFGFFSAGPALARFQVNSRAGSGQCFRRLENWAFYISRC